MWRWRKWGVVHPFLFAAFPVLFLFSQNPEQIFYREILAPIAVSLGLALLLVLVSRLTISGNIQQAGFAASILLLLFFSYGHSYDLIKGLQIAGFTIGRHRYLLFVWGVLLVFSAYLIGNSHSDLRKLTGILNVAAVSLMVVSLGQIGMYELRTRAPTNLPRSSENQGTYTPNHATAASLPDIYYIILDGYASSSTLAELYGYDNQVFISYLTDEGFFVPSESKSNYAMSFLSLASSLNMEYVNYLTDVVGAESTDRSVPYQMIDDNAVVNFLRSRGYRSIHFRSGWGATSRNELADLDVNCGESELVVVLIQSTMLRLIERFLVEREIRERVLCTFSELAEVPGVEGPKFVFAHIVSPHPPFVFGVNGEPVPGAKLETSGAVWLEKENYLNQLIFINGKVEALINQILLNSETAPIIILQADHGPESSFHQQDNGGWDSPTETNLMERMGIFSAYYLSDLGNGLLYDSISPVNTFRLVLNLFFQSNFKRLVDQSYFSNYDTPYRLIDVTDTVRQYAAP